MQSTQTKSAAAVEPSDYSKTPMRTAPAETGYTPLASTAVGLEAGTPTTKRKGDLRDPEVRDVEIAIAKA